MKITIIGSGYVGLVSAICFAKIGHQVSCIDKDKGKIDKLKNGEIPIFEPNLKEMLKEVVAKNAISFTCDLKQALQGSKAVFIAVGTPQGEDGSADLSYVLAAAKEIAQFSQEDKIIITKSTVPVGTAVKIAEIIKNSGSKFNLKIASNPEFLREGNAIEDFINPDRIVIGVDDGESLKVLNEIYQSFGKEKIVATNTKTSELIKYASNSFLATKISFINEMADLCEKTGGDIKKLSHAIGLDSRIGEKFLNVGPGFGGSCFPKDIMAILNIAKQHQVNLSVISSVIESNKIRQEKMVTKITKNFADNSCKGKKIALLGLAFKANTDDIRYSPAISIAKKLLQNGAIIQASDKEAIANSKIELKNFDKISFFENEYDALKNVDLIVIATEWQEYKNLDFAKIKQLTNSRKIIDLRNIFNQDFVESQGFEYDFIGKKTKNNDD